MKPSIFKSLQEDSLPLAILLFTLALWWGLDHRPAPYLVYQSNDEVNLRGVTFNGFHWWHVLYIFSFQLLTAFFGFSFIHKVFKNQPAPLVLFSSFPIGFVASIGIFRILTIFISRNYVLLPGLLILSALTYFGLCNQKWKPNWELSKKEIQTSYRYFTPILGVFFFLLILLMFMGDFTWCGHGQYAVPLQNPANHLQLYSKHYDEPIYHYFLESWFTRDYNALLPWWLTLALVKTSSLSLTYLIFRQIGLALEPSLLASLFLFFGCFGLNPAKYGMIVDSGNPLGFSCHAGRVVGIPLLFLLLHDLLKKKPEYSWRFYLLSGMGIAATTVTNILMLLFLCFIAILAKAQEWAPNKPRLSLFSLPLAFVGILLSWLSSYLSYEFIAFKGYPLLFGILLLLFFIVGYAPVAMSSKALKRQIDSLKSLFLFFCGGLFALLFLGNFLINNTLARWFYRIMGMEDFYIDQIGDKLSFGNARFFGDFREYVDAGKVLAPYAQYSWSGDFLLLNFGFLILLSIFLFWNLRRLRDSKIFSECLPWLSLHLGATFLLPLFYFFVDFTDTGLRAWLETRFFEVPLYAGLFAGIIAFEKSEPLERKRIYFYGLMVLFTFLPFYSSRIPDQFGHNLRQFFHLLAAS